MMIKIDMKKLKEEIGNLNETGFLKNRIKIVGRKNDEVIESFCDAIEEIAKSENAKKKLKNVKKAIELYNDIADQMEGIEMKKSKKEKAEVVEAVATEETETPKTKKRVKKEVVAEPVVETETLKKKTKKKKEKVEVIKAATETPKKKKKKKKNEVLLVEKTEKKNRQVDNKPGVIDSIFNFIKKNKKKRGVTKEEVLTHLAILFPDRDAKAMKSTINCQIGGKVRPTRLEKSRQVELIIEDGRYSVK